MKLKWYHYLIGIIDLIFLWEIPYFFTTASSLMNYVGVILLVVLAIVTYKLFNKSKS